MSILKTYPVFFCLFMISMIMNAQEFRNIDGIGNNQANPEWGSAFGPLVDNVPFAFEDGVSTPARSSGLNPRTISNILFEQGHSINDQLGLNDFIWAFGQFLDHDLTLVHNHPDEEWMTEGVPVIVPQDDQYMTPGKFIPVMRSKEREGTGLDSDNPRQYDNDITSFIDGSAVYGSDEDRASWLRSFEGGKLKTSKGGRLPWNTIDGEFNSLVDPNAPFMEDAVGLSNKLFVAGDVRANENPNLLAIHMLFVREHNRLCEQMLSENPDWDANDAQVDELVYQKARKLVGAMIQRITYEEWLPVLGVDVPDYSGYNPQVNPSISNLFSAAAFRWGHTSINETVLRYNVDGTLNNNGHIELSEAFFNPLESLRLPLEVYFKGMGIQRIQGIDCKLVGSLRSFLFNDNPVLGGLDLAAINIQRGRERGLPDYNTVRESFGLNRKNTFIEICIDETQSEILETVYGSVDNIDPWVGMLAEDHIPNTMFGELLHVIMSEQFDALRTGDRYYYLNDPYLTADEFDLIEESSLSEIVKRNTEIDCFQESAFVATPHDDIPCWPYVAPTTLDIAMSPNPVTVESFLSIFSTDEGTGHIRIVNDLGQVVYQKECGLIFGENRITLDWTAIDVKGHFYVMVEFGDDLNVIKALKL